MKMVDRTLNCPDEILQRILASVDARTAVQTCTLSHKWRNIWVTIPFLNFQIANFDTRVAYSTFVLNFLTHRSDEANLTSVLISFAGFSASQVNWVFDYVIKHKVENFEMSDVEFSGPLSFEFLKSLSVTDSCVSLIDWSCPCLHTLYVDETSVDSDGPVLNLETFRGLERLIIKGWVGTNKSIGVVQIRSNSISGLTLLDLELDYHRFWTPNVSCFKFSSFLAPMVTFPDGLPSLKIAEIDVHVVHKDVWEESEEDFEQKEKDWVIEQIINLFSALSETEFLILSQDTLEALAAALDFSVYQSPGFRRLRSINFPRQLPMDDQRPTNSPDQVIRYLINDSPDANIFVQDRWMRIQEYNRQKHILVRDDLGGFSMITSVESMASEKHVQVQSYIDEHESEVTERETGLSCHEAEIARQEARLKMERENHEKEKSVLMGTASSPDNQDGALEITAGVQQLEGSIMKLTELEQETQRASQQEKYISSSRDQPLSHSGNAFDAEYARWLEEHTRRANELRGAVNGQAGDTEICIIVNGLLTHYDDLYRIKSEAAKVDVFHILSGMWITPAERCFLWLGGFRTSELLKLLMNQLEPLTERQLLAITNLQKSSHQEENAISQGMETLQQSLAGSLRQSNSPGNVAIYMGQTLENFIRQADNLRQQTIQQLLDILTTRESARALLAIHDYFTGLRAISSHWQSRLQH